MLFRGYEKLEMSVLNALWKQTACLLCLLGFLLGSYPKKKKKKAKSN